MKSEEIKKKLKKWKIILWVTLVPIICFIGYAIYSALTEACFFFTCYSGIEGFFFALELLIVTSIYFIVPIILEILDIIFFIVSITKIKKYKKLLNK